MRTVALLVVGVLVVTAGCSAGPSNSSDHPASGTQSISVSAVSNETATNASSAERAAFQNLTADQQRAFERALESGGVSYGPDETPPFDFHDSPRVEYVDYEGQWYFVRVAIV